MAKKKQGKEIITIENYFKVHTPYEEENVGRIGWEEYFMFNALLAADRSSCLKFNTGAAVVKDKRVIATGYNGAPPGIETCLKKGCRKELSGVTFEEKGKSICRGTHAERNAMSQIGREDLKGTSLYSLNFPCSSCAKDIIINDIGEVIYLFGYEEKDSLTAELFAEAGVSLRKMELDLEKNIYRTLKVYNSHRDREGKNE